MKKIIATLFVDEEALKEAYCRYMDIDEEDYSFSDAIYSELTCMEENGIWLHDWKVERNE